MYLHQSLPIAKEHSLQGFISVKLLVTAAADSSPAHCAPEALPEEQQLFTRMAGGDHKAYMVIYNCHRGTVYTLCLRICKNTEIAKELTQQCFIHIWKKKELFRGKHHPASYLYKVVHSQIYQYLKKAKHRKEILANSALLTTQLDQMTWEAPQEEEYADRYRLLDEAIVSLSPKRQEIFILHRYAGMSHHHIAQSLNISQQTVATTMKQAIRHIKNYVQERGMSL